MFDYNSAEKAVNDLLSKTAQEINIELMISEVIEHDFGWVFLYDSAERVQTNSVSHTLASNAPLIFDKSDGVIYISGTAHSLESYLAQYRSGIKTPA